MPDSKLSAQQVSEFASDGAICLRGVLNQHWISRLQASADRIIHGAPTVDRMEFTAPGEPGRFVTHQFLWRYDPVFKALVSHSPLAAIAGQLLSSSKINILFDHLLVKEPGTREPTQWHHDLPYWPIAGTQVLTIWIALDPVTRKSGAVKYIKGSHLWPWRFRPVVVDTEELLSAANMELPPCPDFDRLRRLHSIISWDLAPGDGVAFHALTIHGASGNLSSRVRRRGLATRWTGDDVTYQLGQYALDLPQDPGLGAGSPLDGPLFPVVWRRRPTS